MQAIHVNTGHKQMAPEDHVTGFETIQLPLKH